MQGYTTIYTLRLTRFDLYVCIYVYHIYMSLYMTAIALTHQTRCCDLRKWPGRRTCTCRKCAELLGDSTAYLGNDAADELISLMTPHSTDSPKCMRMDVQRHELICKFNDKPKAAEASADTCGPFLAMNHRHGGRLPKSTHAQVTAFVAVLMSSRGGKTTIYFS